MAEDLDAPAPAPAPAAVADPTPPVLPEPPVDPDEADAVELPAGKHVPLAALKTVRAENQALKQQAAKVAQLEQQIAQLTPYAEFVQKNPQLLQPPVPAQQPQAQTISEQKLIRIAKSLDYYDAKGQPDIERARQHQQLIREEAREMAAEMVGPLAQSTYTDAATRNWNAAIQEKLPNGQPIDQNLLRSAWAEVQRQNPAMTADPRVARVIVNTVMAEQWRQSPLGTQPAPPPMAPVPTEGTGTAPRTRKPAMTEAERLIIGQRMSEDRYQKLTSTFVPGRTNVLEDD